MIIEKIWRTFIDYEKEKYLEDEDDKKIHVHDIIRCKYKYYLKKMFPEVTLPIIPSIFIGESVDDFVKELAKRIGNLESTEANIEIKVTIDGKEKVLVGRPDLLFEDCVVEIKYSRDLTDKPLEHHINQLKMYLFMTGKKQGYLVYITPQGLREFTIEEQFDANSFKEFIATWKSPRYDWECEYCEFRFICPYRIMPTENDNKKQS